MRFEYWWYALPLRLRSLFRRDSVEQELEEELRFHLEQRINQEIAAGLTPEEARYSALRAMDGFEQRREECRDMRKVNFIENFVQDVRYGSRMLLNNRMFTIIAVVTLALGIAVNATIFSLVSGWLLKPPAVTDPDRVVAVVWDSSKRNVDRGWVPESNFLQWREGNRVFQKMAAADPYQDFSITGSGQPERLSGMLVSAEYFNVMGVKPLLGRTFLTGEDRAGHERVAVLSYALWQQRFAADPQVIGKTVALDGREFLVVGVMPAAFRLRMFLTQVWTPLVLHPEEATAKPREVRYHRIFARLKPGISLEQARAEMKTLAARVEKSAPVQEKGWTANVLRLQEFGIEEESIRKGLVMLMTAVALVLLIACGNLANLLLARGSSRQQEIAVRTALGAGRGRVVRQLLTESLLIAILGGSAGLVLAYWGIDLLRAALHFNAEIASLAADVTLDHRVLAFTVLVSMATAVMFGLAPALRISASDPQNTLRQGGRGGDMRGGWGRKALVGGEIALAVLLITGAALVTKATANELNGDYGYDSERVLTADLALTNSRYQDSSRRVAFVKGVLEKVQELPGIEGAGAASSLPFETGRITFRIRGGPILPASDRPGARYSAVTPDYFRVLGIRLLQGRSFGESDTAGTPRVVMINQAFANAFFAGRDAKGSYISIDNGDESGVPVWRQIVGIVPDIRTLSRPHEPQVYEPYLQNPSGDVKFLVRVSGDPNLLITGLRRAIWSVDKDQPIGALATIASRIGEMQGGDVVISTLMLIFGVLALILAGIGIYGVIAYAVAQRTHEIGVRMALGAQRAEVVRSVVIQGMTLAIAGAIIGLIVSAPLPRLFATFFEGWTVQSGPIFTGVAVVVLLVALAAVYIPASRAVRIDPMEALRYE